MFSLAGSFSWLRAPIQLRPRSIFLFVRWKENAPLRGCLGPHVSRVAALSESFGDLPFLIRTSQSQSAQKPRRPFGERREVVVRRKLHQHRDELSSVGRGEDGVLDLLELLHPAAQHEVTIPADHLIKLLS